MNRRKLLFSTLASAVAFTAPSQAAVSAKRLEITVNKVSQKMTVVLDGNTKYVWLVSTGRSGYDTPSGRYRPFRMEVDHFSEEWDDAPMPHSIFFTAEGHAIHGTEYAKSLGTRASHGCVRLSEANAATLYGIVESVGMSNTSVTIKGGFFDFGFGDDTPAPFAVEKGPSTPRIFNFNSPGKPAAKKKKKKKVSFFSSL